MLINYEQQLRTAATENSYENGYKRQHPKVTVMIYFSDASLLLNNYCIL